MGQVALRTPPRRTIPSATPGRGSPRAAVTTCRRGSHWQRASRRQRQRRGPEHRPACRTNEDQRQRPEASRQRRHQGSKEDRDDSRLHLPSLCPLAGRSRLRTVIDYAGTAEDSNRDRRDKPTRPSARLLPIWRTTSADGSKLGGLARAGRDSMNPHGARNFRHAHSLLARPESQPEAALPPQTSCSRLPTCAAMCGSTSRWSDRASNTRQSHPNTAVLGCLRRQPEVFPEIAPRRCRCENEKAPLAGLSLIAGAGFEPATSGL